MFARTATISARTPDEAGPTQSSSRRANSSVLIAAICANTASNTAVRRTRRRTIGT